MSLLLLLCYPVVSHVAILLDRPLWSAVYLLGLIGFFLVRELFERKFISVAILMVIGITGTMLVLHEQQELFIYLPPVVISFGLLLIFGRTLRPGKVPIISRYAELIDGNLSDEMEKYTRQVTRAWAILFLLLTVESIVLAVFAPLYIWSLFTNVINYLAVAVMFIAEYAYRRKTYRDLPRRSFLQFMQKVVHIRPSELGI